MERQLRKTEQLEPEEQTTASEKGKGRKSSTSFTYEQIRRGW